MKAAPSEKNARLCDGSEPFCESEMALKTKIGIGWRPQMAVAIEQCSDLDFIELIAEDFHPGNHGTHGAATDLSDLSDLSDFSDFSDFSRPVSELIERGIEVIVHSTALSLGGADLPSPRHLERINALAAATGATLISDHLAFVRGAGIESGHLLPVERSDQMLQVLLENIEYARSQLAVPLALENISTLFEWPHARWDEPGFLREVLTRSDSLLLLDVSNLYANSVNHGFDAVAYLDALPLERIAYVHIAGGRYVDGIYHDTHTGRIAHGAVALLRELSRRTFVPRVMVEIDDEFPDACGIYSILDEIMEAVADHAGTI